MQAGKHSNPFNLVDDSAYQAWKNWKLDNIPVSASDIKLEIDNPNSLSEEELKAIKGICQKSNMVIYNIRCKSETNKDAIKNLGMQIGLSRLDSNLCADEDDITSLTYKEDGRQKGYIPYSNMRLSWHTDGYYNTPDMQIRGIILHCVQPAAEGGVNALLDHELLYIHLRETNPAYISALMKPDAMIIPPNVENGEEIREAQGGPVFSVHDRYGTLHCRYSARTRNITWKADSVTQEATQCITEYLNSADAPILNYRLEAGEGLLCNNVLHNRTGFSDSEEQKRLLYRARYFDRIDGTEYSNLTL